MEVVDIHASSDADFITEVEAESGQNVALYRLRKAFSQVLVLN